MGRSAFGWACLVAVLATAAPANAQLPLPTPAPPPPPVVEPPPPGETATSFGGDAAHRFAWADMGLRPPLGVAWTWKATGIEHPPLIDGGRVFVLDGTVRLQALQLSDGEPLWNQQLAQDYRVAIGTGDGLVVSSELSRGLRAFDAATGAQRWSLPFVTTAAPLVARGTVYAIGHVDGRPDGLDAADTIATAVDAATGTVRWSVRVPRVSPANVPALSGNRLYLSDSCSAAAVDARSGTVIWSARACTDAGPLRASMLWRDLVIAQGGRSFRAADGAEGGIGVAPVAVVGDLGVRQSGVSLIAADILSGAERWRWTPPPPRPGDEIPQASEYPVVTGGRIWGGAGRVLYALDGSTGRAEWSGRLPDLGEGRANVSKRVLGAAAAGTLVMPTRYGLVALRNAAPGPFGVSASVSRFDLETGAKVVVSGKVSADGHGLIGQQPVRLDADPFPFATFTTAKAGTLNTKDTVRFSLSVRRNTRLKLVVDGGEDIGFTTIYAYPRFYPSYGRGPSLYQVRARVRVRAPGARFGGVRVAMYSGKGRRPRTIRRLGAGALSRGGRARFLVNVRGLGRRDAVFFCVRGMSRQGFGRRDVFDRRCGASRLRIR